MLTIIDELLMFFPLSDKGNDRVPKVPWIVLLSGKMKLWAIRLHKEIKTQL